MRKTLMILILIGSASLAFSNALEKKEWVACKDSKDCVVAGHACGDAYAINKKFQNEFEALLGPAPFECNQPPPFRLLKAECKKSICVVLESIK